jgi:hypothetical protein
MTGRHFLKRCVGKPPRQALVASVKGNAIACSHRPSRRRVNATAWELREIGDLNAVVLGRALE